MIVKGCVLDVADQYGGAIPSVTTLYDRSRFKHNFTMTNIGWYSVLPIDRYSMDFDGTTSRASGVGATSKAMDFVSGDYTVMCWLIWYPGSVSQQIVTRYVLDNNGWEIYLTDFGGAYHLTNRHHHAGTIVDANPRSAYDSLGWAQGIPWFLAITRHTNTAIHYRNGVPVTTTFSTGGLVDPEPCVQAPTIGVRYTLNADWFCGRMAKLRVFNYAMTAAQIRARYHAEKYPGVVIS